MFSESKIDDRVTVQSPKKLPVGDPAAAAHGGPVTERLDCGSSRRERVTHRYNLDNSLMFYYIIGLSPIQKDANMDTT